MNSPRSLVLVLDTAKAHGLPLPHGRLGLSDDSDERKRRTTFLAQKPHQ